VGSWARCIASDNAHKVRRGHAGRVRDGLSGGGLTYGYAPVPGQVGKRVIVESEADVVRRIFTDYVAGRSPRDIAHALNHEGVRLIGIIGALAGALIVALLRRYG
jgi:DNA invertase Pin-like site-specific DNA recombinase